MRRQLSILTRLLKKTISYALYYTGITGYLLKKKMSYKTLVLTYHRVLPLSKRYQSFSHEAIMVNPANFEMQIKVIKEHFKVTDENTFLHEQREKKIEELPRCLITFDDGWYDNYKYAYPILKKNKCNAVVFVPLNYVSTEDTFWQEKLGYMIYKATEINNKQSKELLQKYGISEFCKNNNRKQAKIMNYVRTLKSRSYSELDGVMKEFSTLLGGIKSSVIDKHMTWDQLLELSKNGIKINSHACSHKILTKLTVEEVSDELKISKRDIENKLQIKVDSIAYPNGNYNTELGEFVKEAGYSCGYGTAYGYVDEESNIYNLKRININDAVADSKPVFLATLLGIFQ